MTPVGLYREKRKVMRKFSKEKLRSRIKEIKLLVLDLDGVLTDGRIYFDIKGNQSRSFYFQDIMGISLLKKSGIKIALISGEEDSIIDNFARKMSIEKIYKKCKEKDKALKDLAKHYGIKLSNICFVGDDINDIPAFKIAGLSVGVPNGYPGIKKYVHMFTDKSGGNGAVREVCEFIISNK